MELFLLKILFLTILNDRLNQTQIRPESNLISSLIYPGQATDFEGLQNA
jgi:hypothetical protein